MYYNANVIKRAEPSTSIVSDVTNDFMSVDYAEEDAHIIAQAAYWYVEYA